MSFSPGSHASPPGIRNKLRLAAVVGFFIFLALPLLASTKNDPWGYLIGSERRGLAPPPHRVTKKMFAEFERWYTDRIGFRGVLVRTGVDIQHAILKRPFNPDIVDGSDGWVYFRDNEEANRSALADTQGRLRFSSVEKRTIETRVRAAGAALAACGIGLIIAVAPNKQSIYGEHLPFRRSNTAPVTRLDDLLATLAPDVRRMFLDQREALHAAMPTMKYDLYYKTDTHWNELGAFIAYRQIFDVLRTRFDLPNAEKAELSYYDLIEENFSRGDIVNRILLLRGGIKERAVGLRPYGAGIAVEVKSEAPTREIVFRGPSSGSRLFMLHDSFGYMLIPYLVEHFSQSVFLGGRSVRADYIQKFRPDMVIVSIVERFLPGLADKMALTDPPCDTNSRKNSDLPVKAGEGIPAAR